MDSCKNGVPEFTRLSVVTNFWALGMISIVFISSTSLAPRASVLFAARGSPRGGRPLQSPRISEGDGAKSILTDEKKLLVTRVLREVGFSAVWILDSDDRSELVFLVPRDEGDFSSLEESASVGEIVETLMALLPGIKIWVGPNRDSVAKSQLY